MKIAWLLALLVGCGKDIEGDEPGECEDGADNDVDGTYDCLDLDCAGAPACTDDTPPPDTDDTTDDTTDTPPRSRPLPAPPTSAGTARETARPARTTARSAASRPG